MRKLLPVLFILVLICMSLLDYSAYFLIPIVILLDIMLHIDEKYPKEVKKTNVYNLDDHEKKITG